MAASSAVTTGDIATAAQYNNLRTDVLDSSSSHTHAGTSNTGVKVNSNNLQGTVLASTVVTSSLTTVGTIATGVWQGTDVGVAYGGTGVSTLTDGGVLLGSGSSAITAMTVLADSEMIVGNGSTDPVAESGATLRTSIGVGTGDSPQFTDLTLTDDLTLNSDSSVFNMGAGNDFTITHDGTTGATLAGNPITITSGGAATWSSSAGALTITSAAAATWSTAAGILTIDGDDGIVLNTGGSGDLQINENILVGTDDAGFDVTFYGNTADKYMFWDTSEDELKITGEFSIQSEAAYGTKSTIESNENSNASAPSTLILTRSRGTNSSKTIVATGDSLGRLRVRGWDGGSNYRDAAYITGVAGTGTQGTSSMPGRLQLSTSADGSTSPSERMLIQETNLIKVGGGTSLDTGFIFDNAGTDFHIGIEQAADDLVIGVGSTLGTTSAIEIDSGARIGLGIAPRGRQYLRIAPTFTSDGSSTVASLTEIAGTLTGASGDTGDLSGVIISPTTVTQTATETITNIQSLRVDEPKITDNLTGDITTASTVRIVSAPSEGESNYALFVDAGVSRFDGGAWVGDQASGAPTTPLHVKDDANGVARFESSDGTASIQIMDNASNTSYPPSISTIGDVIKIIGGTATSHNGGLAVNANGTLTVGNGTAQDYALIFDGNAIDYYLAHNDTGTSYDTFSIGHGSTVGSNTFMNFTSNGTWKAVSMGFLPTTGSYGFMISNAQVGTDDQTVMGHMNIGISSTQTLNSQNNSISYSRAGTLDINEPNITVNGSDSIADAFTVRIASAPSEGARNYALWINSGVVRINGAISLGTDHGDDGQQLTSGGDDAACDWTAASSLRKYKNIGKQASPQEALETMLNTPAYHFHYKEKKGTGDTSTEYVGVMADDAPWAMHYKGKIVNPVNSLGYTVLSVQALNNKIEKLEQELEALRS